MATFRVCVFCGASAGRLVDSIDDLWPVLVDAGWPPVEV